MGQQHCSHQGKSLKGLQELLEWLKDAMESHTVPREGTVASEGSWGGKGQQSQTQNCFNH